MKQTSKNPVQAVQFFEADTATIYTIEAAEHITHVPRHSILVYYKHGLISPVGRPERDGYCFNNEAIRTLHRIEYLHVGCGINLLGVKMILHLLNETERLQAKTRFFVNNGEAQKYSNQFQQ